MGISVLQRIRLSLIVTAVWGLAGVRYAGRWQIHQDSWDRYVMGPTLNNQIEIAESLNHYSDTSVWTDVINYEKFPAAIQALPSHTARPFKTAGCQPPWFGDSLPSGRQFDEKRHRIDRTSTRCHSNRLRGVGGYATGEGVLAEC